MLDHQTGSEELGSADGAPLGATDHHLLQKLLLIFRHPQDVLVSREEVALEAEAVTEPTAVAKWTIEVAPIAATTPRVPHLLVIVGLPPVQNKNQL